MAVTREQLEQLVASTMRTAAAFARAYRLQHRRDELTSSALRALADALRTYDPVGGASLPGHVRRRVVGELLDAISADRKRREVALDDLTGELHASIEDEYEALARVAGVEALVVGSAEEQLLKHEAREALRRRVAALPAEARQLLELRHWEERTWKEVATALGVSVRTAQVHEEALREQLRASLLGDDEGTP